VHQVPLVVALREIGALMRPPRFFPLQGGAHDCVGDIEHERQFPSGDALGIERAALIVDPQIERPRLQLMELRGTALE
jgi:hypothetical protein